ncbi:hypothetical protein HDU67_008257 [Dinochytrium kinnereticum]|nr:hypothetical protein HDU67_008257 [Dinochytrium kinnereticum]
MKRTRSLEDVFELVRGNNLDGLKALHEYHFQELKNGELDPKDSFRHGFEDNMRCPLHTFMILMHPGMYATTPCSMSHAKEAVAEWALANGANPDLRNCTGDTPLTLAVQSLNIVIKLMQAKADVNLANDHGNTALHYACFWRRKELALLLVENGAILNVKNKYGKLPLDRAMMFKQILEDVAISHGVSVLEIDAKETDIEIPFKAMTVMRPAFFSLRAEVMMGSWNYRQVVVKRAVMQAHSNEEVALFKNEASTLRKKLHINILPAIGICTIPPNISVVTEFMSNGNLYDYLRDPSVVMDVPEAIRIALEVCEGLQFLHTCLPPIYHMNLKTRNVLLDENNTIKLSEYGYTNTIFNYINAWREQKSKIYFEPEVIAPEVFSSIESPLVYTAAMDVYAFGMVLYEIICREDPFLPGDAEEFIQEVMQHDLVPIIPEYVPEELAGVMSSCWSKDPSARPSRTNREASEDPDLPSSSSSPAPFQVGNIFSDSLRRALSPKPLTYSATATMSQQFYPVAIDNVSSEEIWSPSDDNQALRGNDFSSETGGLLGSDRKGNGRGLALPQDGYEEDDDYGNEQDFHMAREKEFERQRRWLIATGATLALMILGTTIALAILLSKKPLPIDNGPVNNGTYPTVILISLDGFRADYFDRGLSPALASLAYSGVHAEYLKPSFPSITFPNHYTLVTGLYPESHGIVANVFFDPTLNDTFVYVDGEKNGQSKWWGGEPLWVTAIKQGRMSATCMWPGSEAPIQNIRPNYWLKYDGKMTLEARANQILKWLDLPLRERPSFLTLYAPDVDSAGHTFGPNSKAVNDSIVAVDRMVGQIMAGIATRNMTNSVNIVVVSDHGMAEGNTNWIFLDDYVSYDSIHVVNNLVVHIYPKEDQDSEKIYAALKEASLKSGHWDIWKREEVPSYFHYSNNNRIAPFVALPQKNWGLAMRKEYESRPPSPVRGLHGYNNSDVEMRAIFLASGPAFRQTFVELFVNHTLVESHIGSHNASAIHDLTLAHEALGGATGSGGHKNLSTRSIQLAHDVGDLFRRQHVEEFDEAQDSAKVIETPNKPLELASELALNEAVRNKVMPPFNNIDVYNVVSHILKIEPAANNGSVSTVEMLRPWLRY